MSETTRPPADELEEDLPVMTKLAILFVALGQEASGEDTFV